MAKRRRKRGSDSDFADDRSHERDDRREPRRRWIPRRVLLLLIGLGIIASIVLAPRIATTPPVREAIIARVTADLPVQVKCGSLSLAWWAPIELRDLQVHDDQDRLIASISAIETDHSLLQLAMNPQSLGAIRVQAPMLTCYVRDGGSNIEDLLAQLPESDEEPTAVHAQVVIQDAKLRIVDEGRNAQHVVESLNAEVVLADSPAFEFQADGALTSNQRHGQFKASGTLGMAGESETAPIAVALECEALPLAILDVVSRRLGIDLSVSGQATGQLNIDASKGETITGKFKVADLEIYSGMIPDEYFASSQAAMELDVFRSAEQFDIRRISLNANLGDMALSGKLDLSGAASWQSSIRQSEFQCKGQVNVAELARVMPRTLRLRDGIQMTDGLIQWDVSNQADGDVYRLTGALNTEGIRAIRAGQQVDLTRPIDMQVQLKHWEKAFEVEQLVGRSTFVAFSGRGDTGRGQFALRANLDKLQHELKQFFDLRDVDLAGELEGRVNWEAGSDGTTLTAQGEMSGSGLRVALGSQRQWREPDLNLTFQGEIQSTGSENRLTTGSVELLAGEDQLTASVLQPVSVNTTHWPLSLQIRGDLANWRDRLQMVGFAQLPRVTGQFDGTTELTASRDSAKFRNAKFNVEQLDLMFSNRRIREPSIQLTCTGGWDGRLNTFTAANAVLATTTFSIRAEQLEIPLQVPMQKAHGQLNYRGDLARLWQWSQPQGSVTTRRPKGQLVGTLRIVHGQDGVRFVTSNDVRDFSWMELQTLAANSDSQQPTGRRWAVVWQEPRIRLLADGTVINQGRDIDFRNLQAESDAASVQLAGSVTDLTGQVGVRLRGRTRMDFDRLTPRLQPIWGNELRLEGAVDKPLVVEGSIRDGDSNLNLKTVSIQNRDTSEWFPKDLSAQGAIGWERAYAFGFEIGQATVDAQLGNRILHIQPTDLPVSGGTIRLSPRLQLRSPLRMTLTPGRAIDQVSITPEMCRGWLKYVAPLLADVTQAQGKFSMDVDSANIPVTLPDRARVDGKLMIHSANVGPGPTTRELLTVIQQIKSIARPGSGKLMDDNWIQIPQQNVTYQMANRRITHDQMTMIIAGVPVRTQGWVALNQRMSLVAEVPIQEDWLQSNRWLASLKGQTLRIPIRGTLQDPRLNPNVIQNLSRGAVQDAAEGYLQNEVQRQLNRLFERP